MVWAVNATPARFSRRKEAGWAGGPVCRGQDSCAPLGLDLQTVQFVASHSTDWSILSEVKCVDYISELL
jgi:hypothetical protein